MRPVEILALIVAGLAGIKLVIVLIKPSAWKGVVHGTYGKPAVTVPVALLLAVVFLNILLKEMTIVQIFGVMAFMMSLMLAGAAAFGDEITALADKMLQDRQAMRKAWPVITIWIVLIIWVLYELFR